MLKPSVDLPIKPGKPDQPESPEAEASTARRCRPQAQRSEEFFGLRRQRCGQAGTRLSYPR